MVGDELLVPPSEYKERVRSIRTVLKKRRFRAIYLTSPTRILYSTGFAHISTERPLAVVIPVEGRIFLMGPHLESDHVKIECPIIEEVFSYPDYPGVLHPVRFFAKVLGQKGLAGSRIATDSFQGAAGGWGYLGPAITDLMREARFFDGRDIIDNRRLVKSVQELRLLRESARWSKVAHDLLLENVHPGTSDVLAGLQASQEALGLMLQRLGRRYRQLKWGLSPVVAGFRGQVGPDSAVPHTVFARRKIRKGDVLITEVGVEVGGYTSELERTVIVGKPSPKAQKHFETMLRAQAAALRAFGPGVPCWVVDEAAKTVIEADGLGELLRHHTGHGIGLDAHEPPWLDPGERLRMRHGMVFSCEPGIYVPGYAGFRHSDTVEITKNGMSYITDYPREIEELTI